MSAFFPHVNLPALKKFAADTAAVEHPLNIGSSSSHGAKHGPSKTRARVISCEDAVWAGEKMILITFDPKSVPFGPQYMLAHFPRGRPQLTTQALVGMMNTVRGASTGSAIPRVYDYKDSLPNQIGAEVVLMEKIPGEPLDEAWAKMEEPRRARVIVCLVELLLKLFSNRSRLINTELCPHPSPTAAENPRPVLLARPFDEGPLLHMPPQPALDSNRAYLAALAARTERVFTTPSAARETGLNPAQMARVRETWGRFSQIIICHDGGFYVPTSISLLERQVAYSVLRSTVFGIYHSDMQMSRFLVRFVPVETVPPGLASIHYSNEQGMHEEVQLVLATGWEHAHRAPLWSCARFPPWLTTRPLPHEPLKWEWQGRYRRIVLNFLHSAPRMGWAWEWVIAHVYGTTERWFEGCLASPWAFRDALEVLLARLKTWWEARRPDVAFPLIVGKDYVPPDVRAVRARQARLVAKVKEENEGRVANAA